MGLSGPPAFPLPMNDRVGKLLAWGVSAVLDVKPPGTITEKDVINKILNAKKVIVKNPAKDITRTYASQGEAVFHLPDKFNLPDMIVRAVHVEKQSAYGPEDFLMVFLWLVTPNGRGYVPV